MSGSTNPSLRFEFSADPSPVVAAMQKANAAIAQASQAVAASSQSAAAAQAQLAQAASLTGQAFNTAAKGAAALGAAFATMKISEVVRDSAIAAARFETMGVVLSRLAQNTKYSQVQISEFASGVQGMGITMTGSREVIARMIQSQIDLSSATQLARVAQDAAVIGNLNSSEALEHLVYGIQSAQVEMLRTLGLNVSFEQAYARLAATLNKPVEALTELEKTQARVNAALTAGQSIAGSYEAAMGTAGKQLSSMARLIEDLSVNVGNIFLPAFTSAVSQMSALIQSANSALSSPSGRAAAESLAGALKAVADNAGALMEAIAIGIGTTLAVSMARAVLAIQGVGAAIAGAASVVAGHWVLALTTAAAAVAFLFTRDSQVDRDAAVIADALKRQEAAAKAAKGATEELSAAQKLQARTAAEAALQAERAREASLAAAVANAKSFLGDATIPGGLGNRYSPSQLAGDPAAGDPFKLQIARWQAALQEFGRSDQGTEAIAKLKARMDALTKAVGEGNQGWKDYISDYSQAIQRIIEGNSALDAQRQKVEATKNALNQPGFPAFDIAGSQAQITRMLDALDLKQMGRDIVPEEFQKALTISTAAAQQVERLRDAYGTVQAQLADLNPGTQQWNAKLAEAQAIAAQIDLLIGNWPTIMQATRDATAGVLDFGENKPGWKPPSGGGGGGGDNGLREAQIRAEWAQRAAEAEADGAYAVRQIRADLEAAVAAGSAHASAAVAAAKAREAEAEALGKVIAQARIATREAQDAIKQSLANLAGPAQGNAMAREIERQRLLRELGPNQPGALQQGMTAFDWKATSQSVALLEQAGTQARQNLATVQAELTVVGATNAEREKAIAMAQLRQQYEEAIAKDLLPEQKAALDEAYATASAYIDKLSKAKAQLEDAQRFHEAMKQVGDALGAAFEAAIIKGENLNKVMQSLLQTIIQIIAKQLIMAPLQSLFGNALSGLGSSLLGGLFGGDKIGIKSAQGNVFSGHIQAFKAGGFVNSPTIFPMAHGAGLMGEAGPEVIFPVVRTASGDMGVRAVPGGGVAGGGMREGGVVVNINAPPGSSVKQERRNEGGRQIFDYFIDNAMAGNLRPGSKTARALRNNYGAQQQVIKR